jgi:hypothetical protein
MEAERILGVPSRQEGYPQREQLASSEMAVICGSVLDRHVEVPL